MRYKNPSRSCVHACMTTSYRVPFHILRIAIKDGNYIIIQIICVAYSTTKCVVLYVTLYTLSLSDCAGVYHL